MQSKLLTSITPVSGYSTILSLATNLSTSCAGILGCIIDIDGSLIVVYGDIAEIDGVTSIIDGDVGNTVGELYFTEPFFLLFSQTMKMLLKTTQAIIQRV